MIYLGKINKFSYAIFLTFVSLKLLHLSLLMIAKKKNCGVGGIKRGLPEKV